MPVFEVVSSPDEQSKAFDLRKKVFVGEQNVPEKMELDEFDKDAIHVVAKYNNEIVGTGRMVVEGDVGRVGRMAVEKKVRKQGIGKKLMILLEQEAKRKRLKEIYLHAQVHAKPFYEKIGYTSRGEVFDEAGLDHIEMFKSL